MTTPQPAALPEFVTAIDYADNPSDTTTSRIDVRVPIGARLVLQPQPAAADWQTPTTYAQRFTDAVALLCREMPPADMVAGWIDRASDDHRLQDWACERAPAWAQGIGLLDAAHVMADQPTEGVDHEPAQPAAAVSDEEIERIFKKCGGKWNGDHWVIEDADLHPAIREFLALQPQAAAAVLDEEIKRVWLATADQIPHCEHYLHFARAILALRPRAVPMTDAAKLTLIRNFFSQGWAQKQAMDLLHDYDLRIGITAQGAQGGEG